jgi:hypothetical protein
MFTGRVTHEDPHLPEVGHLRDLDVQVTTDR